MHYYVADSPPHPRQLKLQRFFGLICLAVFLTLVGTIWVPYGRALFNATALRFLPPTWAESYFNATLPKTAYAHEDNKLIINTGILHIEAPIIDGDDSTSLLKGVGMSAKSVLPGSQGRVVISGHRFWPDPSPWATVFFSLDKLKIGDSITLRYNNRDFLYHVTEKWDLPKDQAQPKLAPTTDPILTLYTCGPTPYSAKHRLGFNAILDQKEIRAGSAGAIETVQAGVLE